MSFNGWEPNSIPAGTTGDFTFKANCGEIEFKINFLDLDHSDQVLLPEVTYKISDPDIIVPVPPLSPGYEFKYWKIDGDSTNTRY